MSLKSTTKMKEETIDLAHISGYIIVVNPSTEDNLKTNSGSNILYLHENSQLTDCETIVSKDDCIQESESSHLIQISNINDQTCEVINFEDIIVQSNSPIEQFELIDESIEEIPSDHIPTINNSEKKVYICTVDGCNKQYATNSNLITHSRTHSGIKPYQCTTCKKCFNTPYSLNVHTRIHTGDRPYKCLMDECGKAFKTSGDLSKHFRTHTGYRPFKCTAPDCNRWFTTATVRKVHMRTHSGERPFTCSYVGCNKSFSSLTNVNNHERIHSGEKPYKCAVCDKSFTEYSSLFKHRDVHQPWRIIECAICEKRYKKSKSLIHHLKKVHPNNTIEFADIPSEKLRNKIDDTTVSESFIVTIETESCS